MLSIVREGRTIEVSLVFGVTGSFVDEFNTYITQGKDGAASLVAKYEEKIKAGLDDLSEKLTAN